MFGPDSSSLVSFCHWYVEQTKVTSVLGLHSNSKEKVLREHVHPSFEEKKSIDLIPERRHMVFRHY